MVRVILATLVFVLSGGVVAGAFWRGLASGRGSADFWVGMVVTAVFVVAAIWYVVSWMFAPAAGAPHEKTIRCACGNQTMPGDKRCRRCGERLARPA